MSIFCKYEYEDVDSSELKIFGGVRVHMRDPWHLVSSGEVVEMVSAALPKLDESGQPVVELETAEAADDAVEGPEDA